MQNGENVDSSEFLANLIEEPLNENLYFSKFLAAFKNPYGNILYYFSLYKSHHVDLFIY